MTVIFHTNAGLPVLAGDMLLSVPGPETGTDLRLPSQPNGITVPSNIIPEYIPVKMRRKIFVVNDHLAVGAAGSVLHIRTFVEDLMDAFRHRESFTSSEIHGFFAEYSSSPKGREIFQEIAIVALVEATDWRGSLTGGPSDSTDITSEKFGYVRAIGSGSMSVVDQIRKLDGHKTGWSQPPDGDAKFPEFKSLSANIMLLANIYWNEFANPTNIFAAWGGAYDLIYQDANRRFRYLEDYTLVLRLFDAARPDKGIQLMNVLKYEHTPDVSYIAMLTERGLDVFGAKDITASNAPATIQLTDGEFTMNSKYHVSIIVVGKDNRYLSPIIQIDGLDAEEQTKQTVFTWINDERRLCVAFHAEHDEWLEQQALSYYAQHAHNWH